MPRLSKNHAQALSTLRGIAERPLPPEQVGRALVATLERAIGWDGHRLCGVDRRTLQINRLLSASDNDRAARREWLEEVYLDERALPYLQLPEIARARLRGVAYQPSQDQSWGYPGSMLAQVDAAHHRRYFFESQSPIGEPCTPPSNRTGDRLPCCKLTGAIRPPNSGRTMWRSCKQPLRLPDGRSARRWRANRR